jgi:hypothetical protein
VAVSAKGGQAEVVGFLVIEVGIGPAGAERISGLPRVALCDSALEGACAGGHGAAVRELVLLEVGAPVSMLWFGEAVRGGWLGCSSAVEGVGGRGG